MPRTARIAPAGWIFHVLNRASGTATLFHSDVCYRDFLGIVDEAACAHRMRILAYCLMPNHWHMLVWPERDGDLARFVHRFTMRHSQRWHTLHRMTGRGHLYQARYKSFAVRDDNHLLRVCRYIERNALRAKLVARAEDWPWSSASAHPPGTPVAAGDLGPPVSAGLRLTSLPVALPASWRELLNETEPSDEIGAIRSCVQHGRPYGDAGWTKRAAARLGLPPVDRGPGRPRGTVAADDAPSAGMQTMQSCVLPRG